MAGSFRTHDEDAAFDTISIDDFLIENKESTFMVRMRGDGMRESGIFHGDLLVIDRSRQPKPGDIAVVVRDGAFGIVHFNDALRQRSEPALVEAVVTAVIRKFV